MALPFYTPVKRVDYLPGSLTIGTAARGVRPPSRKSPSRGSYMTAATSGSSKCLGPLSLDFWANNRRAAEGQYQGRKGKGGLNW